MDPELESTPVGEKNELARVLPHYLVRLAHEPTMGLHFVASHVRSRGVLVMAQIAKRLEKESNALAQVSGDAQFASQALRAHGSAATDTLRKMRMRVERLTKVIDDVEGGDRREESKL